MFLGRYTHTLDEKGRLTIPARFRESLETGAYVTQGFEQNLMVLTTPAFQEFSRRVNAMSLTDPNARQLRRLWFSTADRIEFDRSGRIRIPQFLMEFAGLQNEIIIVGMGEFIELWSPEHWGKQAADLTDSEANARRFAALDLSPGF